MDWTRNLRIRQLRMLLKLVELGSISEVATEFNLTQPALSKWLKDFEEVLGVTLFCRQARGVRPLPAALALAEQARGILSRLDRLQNSVNQVKHLAGSHIALGVSPLVAHTALVVDAIAAFHKQQPLSFIQVQENSLDLLLKDLKAGLIDVIIGRSEDHIVFEGLQQLNLIDVQLRLAVGSQHPLSNVKEISWQDLTAYPWIMPPIGSHVRKRIEEVLERLELSLPPIHMESNTLSLTAQLLRSTELIAPLASHVINSFKLQRLPFQQLDQEFNAVITLFWRKESEENALVKNFLGHMGESMDTMLKN